MISYEGCVKARARYPYIYFIIKYNYLYIGDTLRMPVVRWSSHVGPGGTFKTKLSKLDEEACQDTNPLFFYSFSCDRIAKEVSPPMWRQVTNYVEHKVHEEIIHHKELNPAYILISDTSRTFVPRVPYKWANDMAREIVYTFADVVLPYKA